MIAAVETQSLLFAILLLILCLISVKKILTMVDWHQTCLWVGVYQYSGSSKMIIRNVVYSAVHEDNL